MTETKAPTDRLHLDRVARAVHRQRLAVADLAKLRATIATLADLKTEHRIVRAGLRNLRVADTQLKDIQARNFGPILDEAAFATLPQHLRRRVLLRLGNIAGRLDREAARRAAQPLSKPLTLTDSEIDPAFKCVRDCRACESVPDASAFWCQLSLVVCLLRTVLPALTHPGAVASPKSPSSIQSPAAPAPPP